MRGRCLGDDRRGGVGGIGARGGIVVSHGRRRVGGRRGAGRQRGMRVQILIVPAGHGVEWVWFVVCGLGRRMDSVTTVSPAAGGGFVGGREACKCRTGAW